MTRAADAGRATTILILLALLIIGLRMWIRSLGARWELAKENRRLDPPEVLEKELRDDISSARERIIRKEKRAGG